MNGVVLRTLICMAIGAAFLPRARAFAEPYLLDTGDQIRIVAPDRPELSGVFVLSPEGEVAAPALEGLTLSGRSLREAAELVRAKLGQKFGAVSVALEVAKYRPFYILGDVQSPGAYAWEPGLTFARAVAIAGGYRRANGGFEASVAGIRATESYATEARQLGEALIERARYRAELFGAESFTVDREAGADLPAEIEARQRDLLHMRLSALQTEKDLLTKQQDIRGKEIAALEARSVAHSKFTMELDQEMAAMRPLVAKGVVPSNRIGELDREQNHVQSDALQTAVLLNQERASKTQTDLQLFTMDNDHREAILVSLNQVDQKIKSIENLMSADKAVAIEAGVSVESADRLTPSFEINRKGAASISATGDENQSVLAGDVVHVRRVLEIMHVAR